LDVSKAIDKAAGAERKVVGSKITGNARTGQSWAKGEAGGQIMVDETAPATADAKKWDGWGTALKPAHEPIVVARKPLVGTVAENVLWFGTGALNIDGCRIGYESGEVDFDRKQRQQQSDGAVQGAFGAAALIGSEIETYKAAGRWPANLILDEEAGRLLDEQSGQLMSGANPTRRGSDKFRHAYGDFVGQGECERARGADAGGASRFFYCAKAGKAERNAGLDGMAAKFAPTMGKGIGGKEHDPEIATPKQNHHPTVKPVALMRYLIRLVTPPGGTVLDPFLGSGTTAVAAILEGYEWIGCELTAEYLPIIEARCQWARENIEIPEPTLFDWDTI
jgi:site-specific DNA-methyltransferase (adenine-specific)